MKILTKRVLLTAILILMVIALTGCPMGCKKPVIYLYPTKEQQVSVQIHFNGKLTCTYPDYKNGWNVTAYPDGRIINKQDGKEYSYLYWEGKSSRLKWDLSEGYVVKGTDTKDFLQNTLAKMGLTPKEYNEFIVYWLPFMQKNPYNYITFQKSAYEESAELSITPKPDSILRVFMVYESLNKPVKVKNPVVQPFERNGFTVVEWGGTEIR